MDSGELVSDDVIMEIVADALDAPAAAGGFVSVHWDRSMSPGRARLARGA